MPVALHAQLTGDGGEGLYLVWPAWVSLYALAAYGTRRQLLDRHPARPRLPGRARPQRPAQLADRRGRVVGGVVGPGALRARRWSAASSPAPAGPGRWPPRRRSSRRRRAPRSPRSAPGSPASCTTSSPTTSTSSSSRRWPPTGCSTATRSGCGSRCRSIERSGREALDRDAPPARRAARRTTPSGRCTRSPGVGRRHELVETARGRRADVGLRRLGRRRAGCPRARRSPPTGSCRRR